MVLFYCFLTMCIRFWTFWNKNEPPSISIPEVIEKDHFLNASRVLFFENPSAVIDLTTHKTSEICRKALLSYFLIILSYMELEKWFLVRSEILGLLDDILIVHDEHFCSNRKNFLLPIQMQLSKKLCFWHCVALLLHFYNLY